MKLNRSRLASLIAGQTLQGSFGHKQAAAVAAYLLEEGQTGELDSLLRDVEQVWARHGTVEVTATTAHQLTDVAKAEVKAQVQRVYPHAKHIMIEQKIDPAVIGGLRLEFTDKRADFTVTNELKQLKLLAQRGKE